METIRIAPGRTSEVDIRQEDCWFCNLDVRGESPPGGWLLDDGIWRAGAAPVGMAKAGIVVLEARRHVRDQAAFDTRESITLVPAIGQVITAMGSALGCDRVYQWSTMAAYEHFHVWLIPWWRTSTHEGPMHLVDVIESPAAQEADVLAAAARVTAALRDAS